ncbi:hypothetical protein PVK06_026776 [Gossypium arboreum]|uniref:DUF4283 domain-containing protein n=1 Tax=Gossypium arboreum TaxID=29729 RepID=A0ABR0NYJ9_GOSAR|nr:hypothetical protein PVK06_026776 [Gossypium arboreum]
MIEGYGAKSRLSDDQFTKKVRFNDKDIDSDLVLAVDLVVEPTISWKDKLYLTVQPWFLEFNPTQPFPSVVMAWIRFPGADRKNETGNLGNEIINFKFNMLNSIGGEENDKDFGGQDFVDSRIKNKGTLKRVRVLVKRLFLLQLG